MTWLLELPLDFCARFECVAEVEAEVGAEDMRIEATLEASKSVEVLRGVQVDLT